MSRGIGGTARRPSGAAVAAIVVLLVATAPLGIATVTLAATADAGQANNTTVTHENPDRVDAESERDQLREWLARRVAERLSESSTELSEGQYNRAREIANESDSELVDKYREVTRSTDEGTSDAEASRLLAFTLTQQRIVRLAGAYNDTYRAYSNATERDNETRARRLARRADRLAIWAEANRTRLVRLERNISRAGERNLTQVVASVNETVADIRARQAEVRDREFVVTRLRLTANESTVAVGQPVEMTGRLTTDDGEPVANRTIALEIANRTLRPTTDADGRFTAVYEPHPASVLAGNLTVRYVPRAGSVHLSAVAPLPVTVQQARPTVTIDSVTGTAGYGDAVRVVGRVTVDGTGVASVPLVVTIDGRRLGRARTAASGSFALERPLPMSIRSGNRTVRVRMPYPDRALTPGYATTSLSVRSTPATISLRVTRIGERSERALVHGRLITDGGEPVANQTVHIAVNGERVDRARTNESGQYAAVVRLSDADLEPRLAAVYDGRETNLAPANATVTLGDSGSILGDLLPGPVEHALDRNPMLVGLAALLVLGAVLLLGILPRRRLGRPPTPLDGEPSAVRGGADGGQPATPDAERAESLLERAQDQLAAGRPNDAVVAGYAAARQGLSTRPEDQRTHWEFYREHAADGLDAAQIAALRELTEGYERVAYAAETLTADESERLLDAARSAVEGTADVASGD